MLCSWFVLSIMLEVDTVHGEILKSASKHDELNDAVLFMCLF